MHNTPMCPPQRNDGSHDPDEIIPPERPEPKPRAKPGKSSSTPASDITITLPASEYREITPTAKHADHTTHPHASTPTKWTGTKLAITGGVVALCAYIGYKLFSDKHPQQNERGL